MARKQQQAAEIVKKRLKYTRRDVVHRRIRQQPTINLGRMIITLKRAASALARRGHSGTAAK